MSDRISGAVAIIYLTICGLLEETPCGDFLRAMDWQQVFALGEVHNLTALTGIGVECAVKGGVVLSEEQNRVYETWIEQKNKAIRKNILIDMERRELESYLEKKGIWYMTLKGIVLKEMYPSSGMRQMADNDILFDDAYAEQVRDFFSSRDYQIESFGHGNHDVYIKKPVYNFEMHRSLYSHSHQEGWKEYYENIKSKLCPVTEVRYAFSDEDFYVYLIFHAYKHHSVCGTGLRTLADIFVCLYKFEEKMNWAYILEQCRILGTDRYEEQMRILAKKVFAKELLEVSAGEFTGTLLRKLTKEEKQLLEYLLNSGTYGTMENRVNNQVKTYEAQGKRNAKFLYFRKRLFPEMEFYKEHYPFVFRHKWLIPGFVVYRLGRGLILRGKFIVAEVRALLQK